MRKILLCFLFIATTTSAQVRLNIPEGFVRESSEDKYSIINASKYDSEGYIQATIEVRYSDDWSFSTFSNEVFIQEAIKTNKQESASRMLFDDFEMHCPR